MKTSLRPNSARALLAAAFALLSAAGALRADVTTYTSESAFLNDLADPADFESFASFSNSLQPSPQTFPADGYTFTLSSGATYDFYTSAIFYPSAYPAEESSQATFTLTFTSGNVTAVGGTFFAVNEAASPADGEVTVQLSTGQSIDLTSTSDYATEPFAGFTSTVPITSLTISTDVTFGQNDMPIFTDAAFDNLYVGESLEAPEPSTWALMLGGLVVAAGWRRLARSHA